MSDEGFLVLLAAATGALVCAGVRPYTSAQLTRWSLRFDVVIDDSSQKWVTARLRRARAIRWIGFAIGVNAAMSPMYMNIIDVDRAASFSNPASSQAPWIAAALGAVLAELGVVQRPQGRPTAAIVRRRRCADYVDQRWIVVIAACMPVAIAAAWWATSQPVWRWKWAWVGPLCAAIALASTTVGVRLVVNRPALAASGQDHRLDDALRSDAAHHIVGASVALAGTGACSSLGIAATGWLGFLAALASWVFLGCWNHLSQSEPWNVARVQMEKV